MASPSILKWAIAGISTKISCKTVKAIRTLENGKEGEEMFAAGTAVLTYSGCTVTEPAGRECKIKGGSITTNVLRSTTAGQAA